MQADSPGSLRLVATPSVTFFVEAGGAPGLLARILEAFARRAIPIDSLTYNRTGDHAGLEVLVGQMTEGDIRQVTGQLRQVIGVTQLDVRVAANQAERMRLCA